MYHSSRVIKAFIALVIVFLVGIIGFDIIQGENSNRLDSIYMTVITLAGVGYGEIIDMSNKPYGRIFTIILILFGSGVLIYFFSAVTAFIVEGDLKRILDIRKMQKKIDKFKDHYIVCGVGKTGVHIIEELVKLDYEFVVIDNDEELVNQLRDEMKIHILKGDATNDEMLIRVGIENAYGLMSTLPTDKDNLFVTISARQLNPNLTIISKCVDLHTRSKLLRAGATSVVSPNMIGGLRIVSEMIRPTVTSFLDVMMRDPTNIYRIDEIVINKSSSFIGKLIKDAGIRARSSVLILAIKHPDSEYYIYIPSADMMIVEGMILVVLGSKDDIKKLRQLAI